MSSGTAIKKRSAISWTTTCGRTSSTSVRSSVGT